MSRKNVILTSDTKEILEKMGARIKKARLRRNISVERLAKQAGVSETTYYAIEKGVDSVSIGAYVAILAALGLDKDFELIALDEEGKEKFWEQNLERRKRASRRKR